MIIASTASSSTSAVRYGVDCAPVLHHAQPVAQCEHVRQVDLSVGSAMGVVGVLIAFLMYTKGWHWTAASLAGLALALAIGLYQGWFVAGLGVASFVVTLGGLAD
jgi:ribose/xylose/arabinose/galactoside ABC-type transport system permease subunit